MDNEIKEILDNFEKYEARYKLQNETQFIITHREIQILLNYITILQQDTEMYAQLKDEYEEEIKDLQQENERLKELNAELKAITKRPTPIDYAMIQKRYEDYKFRCEKASEFIKEKISSTKGVINDYMYHKEHNKHLIELLNEDIEMYKNELNILQNGSEKDG